MLFKANRHASNIAQAPEVPHPPETQRGPVANASGSQTHALAVGGDVSGTVVQAENYYAAPPPRPAPAPRMVSLESSVPAIRTVHGYIDPYGVIREDHQLDSYFVACFKTDAFYMSASVVYQGDGDPMEVAGMWKGELLSYVKPSRGKTYDLVLACQYDEREGIKLYALDNQRTPEFPTVAAMIHRPFPGGEIVTLTVELHADDRAEKFRYQARRIPSGSITVTQLIGGKKTQG